MKIIGLFINSINSVKNLKWNLLNNKFFFQFFFNCVKDYSLAIFNIKKNYSNQILDNKKLSQFKKSETVVIFGSGSSLNKIKDDDWNKIKEFDSIGFNSTIFLKKIHFTFHINREMVTQNIGEISNQINKINENNFLDNTIFLMPKGFTASYTNRIFRYKYWNKKKLFFLFNTNILLKEPFGNLQTGLIHKIGTLSDAMSFAYYMGYKRIILAGVDLIDRRYFFVPDDKTTNLLGIPTNIDINGKKVEDTHQTALNGIVELVERWKFFFNKRGVKLYLLNEKSLLRKYLKIFKF